MSYLNKVKCKGKVVPAHAMKVYRGVVVQLHPFLTLALDADEQSASHCLLYPPRQKVSWHLLNRKLGGPQGHSGYLEKRKFSAPAWAQNPKASKV